MNRYKTKTFPAEMPKNEHIRCTVEVSESRSVTCPTAWTIFVALWQADKYNSRPLNSQSHCLQGWPSYSNQPKTYTIQWKYA